MSCRRNGLREQVTKAKEGTLELRRKRGRETAPGGKEVGESAGALHRESHCKMPSSCDRSLQSVQCA